jgi:hypothetical protein
VPWSACGVDNAPCLTDFDCCDYYACTAGSCEPSCGQQDATCQVDSDCCSDQGLICYLFEQENTSICVPGAEDQPVTGSGANAQLVECGAHCSAYECQLGAACIPPAGDAPDPCAAAGLRELHPGRAVLRAVPAEQRRQPVHQPERDRGRRRRPLSPALLADQRLRRSADLLLRGLLGGAGRQLLRRDQLRDGLPAVRVGGAR